MRPRTLQIKPRDCNIIFTIEKDITDPQLLFLMIKNAKKFGYLPDEIIVFFS